MSRHAIPGADALVGALAGLVACHDLPETPPADPMPLLNEWFEDARRHAGYDDFNAMTLATAAPDGAPAARIVLCKAIELDPPAIVFYSSYESRKGRELEANPRAAVVFHWPHARRQARLEGVVERVSGAESDAYFRTRPLLSRLGACASRQSAPVQTRNDLVGAAIRLAAAAAISGDIERPPWWGGYRIHARQVELWSAREGRLHDRIRWRRVHGDGSAWSAERLGA